MCIRDSFKTDIDKKDIISTYSGVRPLCDDESSDPSAITRDYTLELQSFSENNALISIYGGKITTYRKLSESVLLKLKPFLPKADQQWTAHCPLPGTSKFGQTLDEIQRQISTQHPWLDLRLITRYSKSYGLLCLGFLTNKTSMESLGFNFGKNLYEAEVDYLIEHEWATCADDILWRRTKLGLFLTQEQTKKIEQYIKDKLTQSKKEKLHIAPDRIAI